ncbi:MAG: PEPxxWA-CTERM sorting domain-containing protein, partial [Phenylobacterium sp.]
MSKHKFRRSALCGAAVTALAFGVALAGSASATTFLFSYTSNDGTQSASGTLNADLVAPGQYDATSGTITAFGPLEAGVGTLIANPNSPNTAGSPSGFFTYDDQLLPGQNPLITNPGLLFAIGGDEVNIFSNGPGPQTYQFYVNNGGNDLGNFALSQVGGGVPEPAAWALMILGFGGVGAS